MSEENATPETGQTNPAAPPPEAAATPPTAAPPPSSRRRATSFPLPRPMWQACWKARCRAARVKRRICGWAARIRWPGCW